MPLQPKILVVDDSIAIVNSLQAILGISGYKVETSFNASEALRKIHKNDYDLVICDIEMPGLSGLDFLQRVRQDFDRNLDVILMTGYLEHDYFIEAIRLGASDFIRKPIDTKQMIRSIQELMFRKRSRDDMSEFYCNLKRSDFCFEISAENFSKYAISKVLSSYFRNNYKINPKVLNELLVCIDEMAYNAFIHGTLGLSITERAMDHTKLKALIQSKMQDETIFSKHLRFSISMLLNEELIEISVEDDGPGFDYEPWLQTAQQEQILDIEEHGRGLAMLYHLSDSLSFQNGGRKVTITKSLQHPGADEGK